MDKQEALLKIKELQEYIEECDKKSPSIEAGQLYSRNDQVYIVSHVGDGRASDDNFNLIDLKYKS